MFRGDACYILKAKDFLFPGAHIPLQFALYSITRDFETQRCTGTEVSQILCKIASGVVAVYFQNYIARVEPGVLGGARRFHIDHGRRLIECSGRLKSRVTKRDLGSKYSQTHTAEESVPGK